MTSILFLLYLPCLLVLLVPSCLCETHYSVLGISKNAKPNEIKRAYRKLAHQWHPDKNKDEQAIDMMSKINRAYEILYDEDKRRHYDLLEYDDDYARGGESSTDSSNTDSGYDSFTEGEPTDEINTKQFMDEVLPATITTPYLIYFFHDFCEQCKDWTESLEAMRKDFEAIGVKMASINVIVSSNVAAHCNIYIHEVPRLVLVIDKQPRQFEGALDYEEVKRFIYNELASRSIIKPIKNIDDILSVEYRIGNNTPIVLLVSQRASPSLNYRIVSFQYRKYLRFHFLSSSIDTNAEYLNRLGINRGGSVLYIYSDADEPVVALQGDELNRDNTKDALENNKRLILPKVNTCLLLDELCPVGANTRPCALLVADLSLDKVIMDRFRKFAQERSDKTYNVGVLEMYQNSTLRSIPWDDMMAAGGTFCEEGVIARPILFLHRLTNRQVEFSWLESYCGTPENNSRLMEPIQLIDSASVKPPCFFDPVPIPPLPPSWCEELGLPDAWCEWLSSFDATHYALLITMNWARIFNAIVVILLIYYWQQTKEIKENLKQQRNEIDLKNQIDGRIDERARELQSKTDKLKNKITEQKKEIDSQIKELKKEIQSKTDKLKNEITEKKQIYNRINELDREIQSKTDKLKNRLKEQKNEIDMSRIDELEKEFQSKTDKLKNQLLEQKNQIVSQIDELEKEFKSKTDKLKNQLLKQKSQIVSQIDELEKEFKSKTDKLKSQLEEQTNQIDTRIDEQAKEFQNKTDKLKSQLEKQKNLIEREIDGQKKEIKDKMDKLKQIGDQKGQINGQKKEIEDLKSQVEGQKNQIDSRIDEQAKEFQNKTDKLKSQLEEQKNLVENEIDGQKKEIEDLKSQVEERMKLIAEQKKEIEDQKDRMDKQKTEIEDLKRQLEQLKHQMMKEINPSKSDQETGDMNASKRDQLQSRETEDPKTEEEGSGCIVADD